MLNNLNYVGAHGVSGIKFMRQISGKFIYWIVNFEDVDKPARKVNYIPLNFFCKNFLW